MRVELTFKDGSSIALLDSSTLEPSGSLYVRNRFRAYVPDGNVASFVSAFSDEDNLDEMLFTAYMDETNDIAYQYELHHYTIVADISRKRFEKTNMQTGDVETYYNLVAILEQPTPIEREEPIPDPETEEIINILLGGE